MLEPAGEAGSEAQARTLPAEPAGGAGSPASLEAFLCSVERRALRMAEIATGSRDEALDIVQDAMVGLVKAYRGHAPEAWHPLFHRILQSRIRDWYRRAAVRNRWRAWFGSPAAGAEPLEALPDSAAAEPGQALAAERFGAALERALRALPLRQQQVFLLRVWEGLDVAGTAAAMGISAGSVKTHYSRAVHTLRARLEEYRP